MALKLLQAVEAHQGKAWSVTWSPNGDKFITCGEDKVAKVWKLNDKSSGDAATFLTSFGEGSHQKTVRDVAWSPCGRFVVLGSFDAQVTLWEVQKNGKFDMLSVVEGHENEVKSVAWSPSGKFFASCGRDKNVMIWNMIIEKDDIDVECAGVMTSHNQDVKRVVWHPFTDTLASCSYDDTVNFYQYDEDNGDWITSSNLKGHASTVWGIDFDEKGTRLASCSDDKTVKIWESSKCVCTISGYHKRPVYDVAWNKKNGLIATACGDNHVRVFKEAVAKNELERNQFDQSCSVNVSQSDVNCVSWNPKRENVLLSLSDDGFFRIWEWVEELI